jgi:hypothetical protein
MEFTRAPAGDVMVCVGDDLFLVLDSLRDYSTRVLSERPKPAFWEQYWEDRAALRARVEVTAALASEDQIPTLEPHRLPVLRLALRALTLEKLLGLACGVSMRRSNDSMFAAAQQMASMLPPSIAGKREEKEEQDRVAFPPCDACGRVAKTKTCAKCKQARYCCRQCQLDALPKHKKVCKKPKGDE